MTKTTVKDKTENRQYKRVAAITVPTFSIADVKQGQSIFVRFVSEIVDREQTEKDGAVKMENGAPVLIHIARVLNLGKADGELCEMVVPHIVNRELRNSGDYVGKPFEMIKGAKKGRMNMWTVYRLEE